MTPKPYLYLNIPKQIILILFCFGLFQNGLAQSCSDTAKKIDYFAAGYYFSLQQHVISHDITYLAGRFQNTSSNDRGIFAFKIAPDGNPVFSKKIDVDVKSNEMHCNGFLRLKNGNHLLAIGQPAAIGTADSTLKVIILDNAGNLIWAKEYFDSFYDLMSTKSIQETDDGDIIMMLNFYSSEAEDAKAALVKISNAGDIIWASYYTLPQDNMIASLAFSLSKNNIYMVGLTRDSYNFFMGYPDYEHNFFAAKINQSNGNLIDSKSFLNMRMQYAQYGQSFMKNIFANLAKTQSGNFIFTNQFENSRHFPDGLHGLQKIHLDTSLNFSKAVFYSFKDAGSTERIIANEKAEVITYGENLSGGALKSAFVSKFNALGKPIREIQIR